MLTAHPLTHLSLFSQLSAEMIERLISKLKPRDLAAGEILFNLGDPGDELILVESGKIAIYIPHAGSPGAGQAIRLFQAGDVLGEMALIDRRPHSFSARAEQASRVSVLGGPAFQELLATDPELILPVMGGLSERIRCTTDFLAEVRMWVNRIAEGNYETDNFESGHSLQDNNLAALAAEFAQMAARLQQREETLRQQVAQLRIEIDEFKRKREVEQITDTDYYQDLRERVRRMREEADR